MNRIQARAALAATAAAVLVASGCGDESSTSSSASGSQARADLVQQADAICTAENEKRTEQATAPDFGGQQPSSRDLKESADYFKTDLQVTQELYKRLSELPPPADLEQEWSKLLAEIKDGVIANYPDLISAARAGDTKAFLTGLNQVTAGTQDLPQLASTIGLQVCATGQ